MALPNRLDARHTRTPNIVLVVTDDLGWSDLTCYGSTFYETPHLDRLAAEGIRFTDAYAAAPVCSPTRASLMSGKYPARVGVTQHIGGHAVGRLCDVPYRRELPMSEYSLARALRDGGYRTWHVGKWHLGGPATWPQHHGFDINIGGCDWGSPPTYFSPYRCPTLADGPDGEYLTDRLTDEAITLIESGNADRPFFLNLWHYAVHTPIQAPADLVAKYTAKAHRLGLDKYNPIVKGESMPPWHLRHHRVQRRTFQSDPAYAAMIENLDNNIGRLLHALDRAGQADNTIVMFTSDNGGLSTAGGSPTCNTPLSEGKGWMRDGGLRVPLIVRWPGIVRGESTTRHQVTTPDFYPTITRIAGIDPPRQQHLDGVDFGPVMRGQEIEDRPIYWHYPHYPGQGGTPGAAVREGQWKLIRYFEDNHNELYDLDSDISEVDDLTKSHPDISAHLRKKLDRWLLDVGAILPQPNPNSPFPDLPG